MRELEAQTLARAIKLRTEINVFEKTRRAENVYCRSVFNNILKTKHNWGLTRIATFYKNNGYKSYDHATVFHSLKRYNDYVTQYPELTMFLDGIDEAYNNRDSRLTDICQKLPYVEEDVLSTIYETVCKSYMKYVFENTFNGKDPKEQDYRKRKNKYVKLSEQQEQLR